MTNNREYTVFFDQINRCNFQVLADGRYEALAKAKLLYIKYRELPDYSIQEGFICKTDGEDK
jgi:hypothetical protein